MHKERFPDPFSSRAGNELEADPSLRPDRKFCSQDRKTGGFSRDSKHYCCGWHYRPETDTEKTNSASQLGGALIVVTYAPLQPRNRGHSRLHSSSTKNAVLLSTLCLMLLL